MQLAGRQRLSPGSNTASPQRPADLSLARLLAREKAAAPNGKKLRKKCARGGPKNSELGLGGGYTVVTYGVDHGPQRQNVNEGYGHSMITLCLGSKKIAIYSLLT